jgi:hypothetical protein
MMFETKDLKSVDTLKSEKMELSSGIVPGLGHKAEIVEEEYPEACISIVYGNSGVEADDSNCPEIKSHNHFLQEHGNLVILEDQSHYQGTWNLHDQDQMDSVVDKVFAVYLKNLNGEEKMSDHSLTSVGAESDEAVDNEDEIQRNGVGDGLVVVFRRMNFSKVVDP